MMYQTPNPPKLARGENMTFSPKKWDRVTLPCPHLTAIMENLGECISRDTLRVKDLGWEGFMREKQGRRDFTELGGVE